MTKKIVFTVAAILCFFGSVIAQTFNFNNGTDMDWTIRGAYDEDDDGPFSHNFGFFWHDLINYPNAPGQDASSDNQGAISLIVPLNPGIANKGATWWIMRFQSPDLSSMIQWQTATGYTVEIADNTGAAVGPLYSNLFVVVTDYDSAKHRIFYNGEAQALDKDIYGDGIANWNHLTFDWSAIPTFPTNYQVEGIFVNIWGLMGSTYEGVVSLDEVTPVGCFLCNVIIQVQPIEFILQTKEMVIKDTTFTISNLGEDPLVFHISAEDGGKLTENNCQEARLIDWLSFKPNSGTVPSGESQVIRLKCDASVLSTGTYNAAIHVNSNDPQNPVVDIPLTLEVTPYLLPDIDVSPSLFNIFIEEGSSIDSTFSIVNSGGGELNYCIYGVEDTLFGGKISENESSLKDQLKNVLITGWGKLYPDATPAFGDFKSFIEKQGYNVSTSDTFPPSLDRYDILILVGGGSADEPIPAHDVDTFVGNGGGLIVFEGVVMSGDFPDSSLSNPVEAISGWVLRSNTQVANFNNPLSFNMPSSSTFQGFSTNPTMKTGVEVAMRWADNAVFAATYHYGKGKIVYINDVNTWFSEYWKGDVTSGEQLMLNTLNFVQPVAEVNWLLFFPQFGTVPQSRRQPIKVIFDATRLSLGNYNANILVTSNDPDEDPTIVPVTLEVSTPTVMDNYDDTFTPFNYQLGQNYPNPFNPETTIEYALPEYGHVTITIYNLLGDQIATLINQKQETGNHFCTWDAKDYPSGVYIYKLETESFTQVKKMLLLR